MLAATEPVEPQRARAARRAARSREVEALCDELAREYERDGRGFVLARVAGGYRFQTHPDLAPYVERFVLEGQHARLSAPGARDAGDRRLQAADLARPDLGDPRRERRGDARTRSLQRGYVQEVGPRPGPGHAVLYGTTTLFLERLGLDSLADLPPLGDFVPDASVVEALERGLRIERRPAASSDRDADADDAPSRLTPTGDGDASRGRAAAEGARARRARLAPGVRGADRRRAGHRRRRGRGARATRRPRARPRSRSTACPSSSATTSSTTCSTSRRAYVSTASRSRGPHRPWSSSCRPSRACSRSAASTTTPRACWCSPTTASSPSCSPTRATAS